MFTGVGGKEFALNPSLSQTYTQGSGLNATSYSPDASTNRYPSLYGFDAAGNVTNDDLHQYRYDAEGNVISIDNGATTYSYDALNRRPQVQGGEVNSLYAFDTDGRCFMTFHLSGSTLAQASANAFWGHRLLATNDQTRSTSNTATRSAPFALSLEGADQQ